MHAYMGTCDRLTVNLPSFISDYKQLGATANATILTVVWYTQVLIPVLYKFTYVSEHITQLNSHRCLDNGGPTVKCHKT